MANDPWPSFWAKIQWDMKNELLSYKWGFICFYFCFGNRILFPKLTSNLINASHRGNGVTCACWTSHRSQPLHFSCLVLSPLLWCLSCCCDTLAKETSREKGFICLIIPGYSLLLQKMKARTFEVFLNRERVCTCVPLFCTAQGPNPWTCAAYSRLHYNS